MTKTEFASVDRHPGQGLGWRWFLLSVCLLLLIGASTGRAQEREGISEADVATLAGRAVSEFNVPGMAW